MLKILWKFFVIGILCNSLLLMNVYAVNSSELALVNSRLDMMNKRLATLTIGSAAYTQQDSDIKQLQEQQTTLSQQVSSVTSLETKLAAMDPTDPGYQGLKDQIVAATIEKQSTLNSISQNAAQMATTAKNEALRAQGVTSNSASNAALQQAQDVLAQAIDSQNVAVSNAQKIVVHWAGKRAEAQQKAANYLAHGGPDGGPICPRSITDAQDNVITVPCTAQEKAAADAQFGVPGLQAEEDAAIAKKKEMADKIPELIAKKETLTADAKKQREQVQKDMQGSAMLSVGDFTGVNARIFSDGTTRPIADQALQKIYDDALHADITMVILGTVTTRLMSCKAKPVETKVPDMEIAATAGLAFVSGEVAEYTDLIAVKTQLDTLLKDINGDPTALQVDSLKKLKALYTALQGKLVNKKAIREASQNSFLAAADIAASEATMLATMSGACTNEINSKVSKGVSSANSWAMIFTLAAIAMELCSIEACYGWCSGVPACRAEPAGMGVLAAGAAVAAVAAAAQGAACDSGGSESKSMNSSRVRACEDRNDSGAHIHDKTTERASASSTVSTNITNQCLAMRDVGSAANNSCDSLFASDGKGPYASCGMADTAYEKNNVSCPLNELNGSLDPNFYKPAEKFTSTPIKPRKNYFDILADIMFSTAHAGMLSAMGVSKDAVITFIKNQAPIFADALDTQLSAPVWRSIAWKALADLVLSTLDSTDKMLGLINADLQQIQQIIDSLSAQLAAGAAGRAIYDTSKNFEVAGHTFAALPCIIGDKTGNCKSLSEALKNSPGFLQLPLEVQALALKATSAGNGIAGATSFTIGALANIGSLNKAAGAIRADLYKRQQNLQKILSRDGLKIDMNKEASKFAATLTGITKTGLKASNMSASQMHALMGGGDSSLSKLSGKTDLNNSGKSKGNSNDRAVSGSKNSGASGSSGDGQNSGAQDGKGADGLTDAERAAKLAAEAQAQALAQAQAKKASGTMGSANQGDTVHDDNGYTLFEVITNRYQKSAYPRLFKKINE